MGANASSPDFSRMDLEVYESCTCLAASEPLGLLCSGAEDGRISLWSVAGGAGAVARGCSRAVCERRVEVLSSDLSTAQRATL